MVRERTGSLTVLSIRNQFAGTVTSIARGDAMAVVQIQLTSGETITSSITRDAVEDLGLAEGSALRGGLPDLG
jgi:molybdopterin-binding protein